jgi:hypothetical protein
MVMSSARSTASAINRLDEAMGAVLLVVSMACFYESFVNLVVTCSLVCAVSVFASRRHNERAGIGFRWR